MNTLQTTEDFSVALKFHKTDSNLLSVPWFCPVQWSDKNVGIKKTVS